MSTTRKEGEFKVRLLEAYRVNSGNNDHVNKNAEEVHKCVKTF